MNLRCRPLFLPSEVVYGRLWGVTRGVVLLLSTSATIPHKMLLIGAQQPMATESSFYEYMVKICYTIPGFDSATPRTWSDHNKMYKKSMSTFKTVCYSITTSVSLAGFPVICTERGLRHFGKETNYRKNLSPTGVTFTSIYGPKAANGRLFVT